MSKKAQQIKLLTSGGQVILSFLVTSKEVDLGSFKNQPEETDMTEAQEKYLLNLLAEQGIKDEKANQRLLELFEVENLEKVTKLQACGMIKTLLKEKGDNHKSSDVPQ